MHLKTVFVMCCFIVSLFCLSAFDADAARRFGGGKSFGSKPGMNRSTTAPKQQQPGVAQQATKKSGFLGGAGGMIGGLLAGTLLGSLLFGGGFDGGGFMDILLIALVAYLGFKLFSAFRRRSGPSMAGASYGGYGQGQSSYQNNQGMAYQSGKTSQDMQGGTQGAGMNWSNLSNASTQTQPQIPPHFNVQEFVEGAKMAFNRLQAAWDKRDLDDIALFTAPTVLEEIKRQMAEESDMGTHEVLLNNAQLLSVTEESGEEIATIYFDVVMREDGQVETMQVREIWHFMRPINGGNWKLGGIQQIEN